MFLNDPCQQYMIAIEFHTIVKVGGLLFAAVIQWTTCENTERSKINLSPAVSFLSQYVGDRTTKAISLPLQVQYSNFEFAPLSASFFWSPRKFSFFFLEFSGTLTVSGWRARSAPCAAAASWRAWLPGRFVAIVWRLIFDLWSFGGKTLRWSARKREIDLVTDLDGKVVVSLLEQLSNVLHFGHLTKENGSDYRLQISKIKLQTTTIKNQTTDYKDQTAKRSNLQPAGLELATSTDSMAPAVLAHVLHDCLKVFSIILVFYVFKIDCSLNSVRAWNVYASNCEWVTTCALFWWHCWMGQQGRLKGPDHAQTETMLLAVFTCDCMRRLSQRLHHFSLFQGEFAPVLFTLQISSPHTFERL